VAGGACISHCDHDGRAILFLDHRAGYAPREAEFFSLFFSRGAMDTKPSDQNAQFGREGNGSHLDGRDRFRWMKDQHRQRGAGSSTVEAFVGAGGRGKIIVALRPRGAHNQPRSAEGGVARGVSIRGSHWCYHYFPDKGSGRPECFQAATSRESPDADRRAAHSLVDGRGPEEAVAEDGVADDSRSTKKERDPLRCIAAARRGRAAREWIELGAISRQW